MLTISKPAEFSDNNLPLRGQCQPHTHGWRLRLVHGGKAEVLYQDTYYACREIQEKCEELSADEDIRAKVRELAECRAKLAEMQETQRVTVSAETPTDTNLSPTVLDMPSPFGSKSEATEVIPREEMERQISKRRRDFEQ
jgi:hypothetical protein